MWCNGIKIIDEDTMYAVSSPGLTYTIFGSMDVSNDNDKSFKGDIAFFALYKNFAMHIDDIKTHHKALCERYSIDHVPISIT